MEVAVPDMAVALMPLVEATSDVVDGTVIETEEVVFSDALMVDADQYPLPPPVSFIRLSLATYEICREHLHLS